MARIAIQGHQTRGKEVIQILESLGGRNTFNYNGDFIRTAYFIGMDYSIYGFCTDSPKVGFKVYTLEEFEKEFPFKVGDIVLLKGVNKPYEIIALELYMNKLCYKLDNGLHYAPETLTIYEKMKEERNIKLTLDKAKEWYKKGGDLKQVALQAFTEKELTKVELPKSWEEFCITYPMKNGECYIGACDEIHILPEMDEGRDVKMDRNVCPSQKSAEAHLAMMQLEQLRDCWRKGWEPTKCDTGCHITHYPDGYSILSFNFISFLSFPTRKMAEEFLECFRDLIEKAGDLI